MMQHVIQQRRAFETKKALVIEIEDCVARSVSGTRYFAGPEDMELLPGIKKKLWSYRLNDYLIFAVGYDPSVANGLKPDDQVMEEQRKIAFLFGNNNPFHSAQMVMHYAHGHVGPYNHRSLFTMPEIGVLVDAEKLAFSFGFSVDWDHSLFVGKTKEAEECARRGGITFRHIEDFIHIPKGNGGDFEK